MEMLLIFITVIFLASYAVLIKYYQIQWRKTPHYIASDTSNDVYVSVIIAARNEEYTLPLLLNDLARQDYPAEMFEVIVVDDFSTDNTHSTINGKLKNLKVIFPNVAAVQSSKKIALTAGIEKANGKLLIITDADCRVKVKWISTYVSFFKENNSQFIAGPVMYNHTGSILQTLQALDFITLQGITAASVSSGFHNMCNGANLAYTKEAFLSVHGFSGIDKLASGDDMLLMHKIAKISPGKVHYIKNDQVVVTTDPMINWKLFINQRRRWASKTLVYKDYKIVLVLFLVLLFNLLFIVLLAFSFFQPIYFLLVIFFVAAKTVIEYPFVFAVAQFFKQEKLMKQFVFLQPIHILYTVIVGFISQFGKYNWKGRKVH